MSNVTAVTKLVALDLTDIPNDKRKAAKTAVGNYLVESILREVGNGKSPVEGETFKKLGKEYAKKEHGGRRLPILELEGDMLAALKSENKSGDNIEVGITGVEAPKADGHNQISAEAKAWASKTDRVQYKRRYIPDGKQNFKKKIRDGVSEILGEYRITPEIEREEALIVPVGTTDSVVETPEKVAVTNQDYFSDDLIEELLFDAIRRRDRGN